MKRPALRQRVVQRVRGGGKQLRAVLRPWVGRWLPRELRAENVAWLAQHWPDGVRSAEYERLVQRIDTGPVHAGDRVEVYHHGHAAAAAIGDAIDRAREEVLVETYILKDDDSGRGLLETLARAVRRGVKVRVLADAAGSWFTKRTFWRDMERHGIEARLFHPLLGHVRDLLLRDHRKIIVVDRAVCFTGGMNVANEYGFVRKRRPGHRPWRDTHVRLEGTSAWEMAVVFNEGWSQAGADGLTLSDLAPSRRPGAKTLVLDCRAGRGHAEAASVLAATIAAARRRLWITNAYFAPNRCVLNHLCAAGRRGVDVRLLLPGHSDMPLVRRAGHGFYAELLASGVRIWEYQPAVLHAKTLVADDYASMIGSSNLDYRSYYFNAECNALILCAETGSGMAAAFERDLQESIEITPHGWEERSLFKRMGDACARALSPLL
jgi:cardiolipin synthase